jgi:hypothetical protein
MVIPRANTIGTTARTTIGDITIIMGTSATHTGITATAVAPGSGLVFNSIKPKFQGFDGRLGALPRTSNIWLSPARLVLWGP